ncbi:MAG TPA: sigma-70 family RNA polymerase sigma factor [Anaerolineales bacterium]|nr:sigma-70 family RNA polymerase sigma factor [Anaerolineales bacterium]
MVDPASAQDSDLAALARRGDVNAIGALYDRHHEALFRYIWSRVGERETAEDMTGEVFTRMLAALPRYQPTATPFRAWLYRIAHNLVVDHYRKEGGRTFLSLDQAEAQSDEAGDLNLIVEWNLTIEQVHHALARLDEAQREVVSLRFLSGLSLQEVAAALEKSEGAIKALQHRGLAALRRALVEMQISP